jgi:hypothetical protein
MLSADARGKPRQRDLHGLSDALRRPEVAYAGKRDFANVSGDCARTVYQPQPDPRGFDGKEASRGFRMPFNGDHSFISYDW